MHTINPSQWQHDHRFDEGNPLAERNTRLAVSLTALMMVVEIIGGLQFNSMALLADGWHMGTHVIALGITAFAYGYARRHANDRRFTFGTWKVGVLGGYTSAIILGLIAAYMAWESIHRLIAPQGIHYAQALWVALVGLLVNLVCAYLLQDTHTHTHSHDHDHGHHDLNLRSAYLHVIADAFTSVLAVVALIGGKIYGWWWLDAVMGIVGAIVVSRWALGLMKDTSRALLDKEMDSHIVKEIHDSIESDSDAVIVDLHLWRIGSNKFGCIISLVATNPKLPDHYKALLGEHQELRHITVEVYPCLDEAQKTWQAVTSK